MEELAVLIERSQAGEKEARKVLVEQNLGLVHHIVKRFIGRGYDAEELFQVGSIGLLKAIDKFDTSYEVQFSTYAVPMISGEIKRFLRDDGMVKISRNLKENSWRVKGAMSRLASQLGREPTLQELASETELSTEDILLAMDAGREVESIHKVVYQSDGNPLCLEDKIPETKDRQEEFINRMLVEQLLQSMEEKEKKLIKLRYFENMTQIQVARILEISQVQVSRMEKKTLRKLRQAMEA